MCLPPPHPPPPSDRKRFSIRLKLLIIFGLLIALATIIEGLLAVSTARQAVTEKIETHLIDKASDVAEILDGRINAMFQFLEGLTRMSQIRDTSVSYRKKTSYLIEEAKVNPILQELYIVDAMGVQHHADGNTEEYKTDLWFIETMKGKKYTAEPYIDKTRNNQMFITFSLPVYDDNKNIIGVLGADIDAFWLSEQIKDILVGQTGHAYIIGATGTTIADPDFETVTNMWKSSEEAKKNAELLSLANFEKMAINANEQSIGFYEYGGITKIASHAKIKTTDWTIVINAPIYEFMGTISTLRTTMFVIGFIILSIALVVTYLVSVCVVRPISNTVLALKDIAEGDGDLTVRLPSRGNDEITDLSFYFNQTISKIGESIRVVETNAEKMEGIGSELASNMTETASSVHEISSNIDSVKGQTLTQAASVTETASTIEEITRTIKQLNGSIESQAASVAQSSSSIEEMVANISSITGTLEKTDGFIKELGEATRDGKETLIRSNTVTERIAEESGSLMEASSVIQHIASQTNLLAMNAAIEAAHAGEAGKGFAVVADEIRKLAEESSTQGKTITATLKSLSGEIEGLSSSSKIVETKFNAIFELAAQVKEMSQRLMEAMREQENGSREVLIAIKDINTVTSEVQAGSAEMLKGSEGVAREMEKLDGLTRVITDSMNEMAAGAMQISNAVQEVAEITQKNKMSINDLVQEVGKFKV